MPTEKQGKVIPGSKLKDCPTLAAGELEPEDILDWYHACRRFAKQSGKDPDKDVVCLVADATLEPRFVRWYMTDHKQIDKLTLKAYISEFATLALSPNWEFPIRTQIQTSSQGPHQRFHDWRIKIETLNAILELSSRNQHFSEQSLRDQMESCTRESLRRSLTTDPIPASVSYEDWTAKVQERDQRLRDDEERMDERLTLDRKAYREHKTLAQRISNAPSPSHTAAPSNPVSANRNQRRTRLPALTAEERALLDAHDRCTRCRVLKAGHRSNTCPMALTNTWPDPATYIPVTQRKPGDPASKPSLINRLSVAFVSDKTQHAGWDSDDDGYYDDDTYASPSVDTPPFTMPHLYLKLEISGPSISTFPLSVKALPDIGCPSTVISDELVTKLGLRRFPLPKEEDNLSSLSGTPLESVEYVKLQVTSGKGSWVSQVHRAKVNVGLPVPLLLGIPFLHAEHIVLDVEKRTAIVRDTGYNLANTTVPKRIWAPPRTIPPLTPPKPRPVPPPEPQKRTTSSHEARAIVAAVQARIETLVFQEELRKQDQKLKDEYTDLFPTRLPDVSSMPDHIY
ncbi:hypothetical protein BJ165DRAFT_1353819, partial [Panaeolus papilionaceus]